MKEASDTYQDITLAFDEMHKYREHYDLWTREGPNQEARVQKATDFHEEQRNRIMKDLGPIAKWIFKHFGQDNPPGIKL